MLSRQDRWIYQIVNNMAIYSLQNRINHFLFDSDEDVEILYDYSVSMSSINSEVTKDV